MKVDLRLADGEPCWTCRSNADRSAFLWTCGEAEVYHIVPRNEYIPRVCVAGEIFWEGCSHRSLDDAQAEVINYARGGE